MKPEGQSRTQDIFVIAEVQSRRLHSCTFELTGKAVELAAIRGSEVVVIVLGNSIESPLEEAFRYGADRVLFVEHDNLKHFDPEVWTRVLAHLVRKEEPEIVLAPATTTGRTVLPALAAKLGTGLTADCTGLDIDAETGLLLQTRPAIGGNVIATIKTPEHRPQMSTVRPKNFRLPEPMDRDGRVERPELPEHLFSSRIRQLDVEALDGAGENIQDLDVIVSGGKGLKKPENFALLRDLAALLDGAVGASRPAVEAKWIAYPFQVGLSGKVVSPRVYVAAGISGAVQHLAGIQTSETIIAINKDPEAPIFRVADVALCGDLFEIVPMLTDRIRREKGEKTDA